MYVAAKYFSAVQIKIMREVDHFENWRWDLLEGKKWVIHGTQVVLWHTLP